MKNENNKLKLLINDLNSKNEYDILKNETLIIESKDIKEKCQNEHQICIISFNLISENTEELLVELRVSAEINSSKDNNDNIGEPNGTNNLVVLIIIIFAVIIIIILITIIIIKLKNKKGDNIKSEIDSIKDDNQKRILSE